MNIIDTIKIYLKEYEKNKKSKIKIIFEVFCIYFRYYFMYDLSYYFWRLTGGPEKTLKKISMTHERTRNIIKNCKNKNYSYEETIACLYGHPPGSYMQLDKTFKLWIKNDKDLSGVKINLYHNEQADLKMVFLHIKKIFPVNTKKIIHIDYVILSLVRYFFEDVYINKNIFYRNKKEKFNPPITQLIKEFDNIKNAIKQKTLKGFIVIKEKENKNLHMSASPIKSINLYLGTKENILLYLEKKPENHGKKINLKPVYIIIE